MCTFIVVAAQKIEVRLGLYRSCSCPTPFLYSPCSNVLTLFRPSEKATHLNMDCNNHMGTICTGDGGVALFRPGALRPAKHHDRRLEDEKRCRPLLRHRNSAPLFIRFLPNPNFREKRKDPGWS